PAPALELEKSASPSTYGAAGDEITYTFTVTNTGNVALSDVRIRDAKLGISDLAVSPSTLQPGATGAATATYVITAADVTAGTVANTATASGRHDGQTVSDTDTATITVTGPPPAPALELEKSASPSTYRAAGDEITYTFTVTNTGNVALSDVRIRDAKLGITALAVSPSTLQPGATGTATATYVITAADVTAGTVANTATASGLHDGQTVSDTDTATITVTGPPPAPALELEKSASPSTYRAAGEEITYTFTVTNTGNVALSDVRIRDAKLGISDLAVSPSTLQPGATGTATATYVITAADVTAGSVENTATALGRHNGTTVRDTDTATITVTGPPPAPALELEKSASPSTYGAVGEEITYTFTVTNTGNVALSDVRIRDAKLGISDLAVSPSTLQPGATGTATATYVITAADVTAGSVENTATALGRHNGATVRDTDTATITVTGPVPAPALELEKSASPSTYRAAGDEITYTFTVTNTGNVALSDVRIRDAKLGISDLAVSPSTLQPGATGSATATYVITAADVTAGSVENTATASGRHNGQTVSDTDTATITVTGPPPAPALELEKSASPSTYRAAGDEITYTFTVTNTGNVALSDVRIRDAKLGISDLAVSPSTLRPGATGSATATYVITAADVTAGRVANTATALGSYDGETVSDTDTAIITVTGPVPAPALELEKSASPSTYRAAGEEITYTFTVTNTGNVPLTNVVIEDAKLGISDLAVSPATLQPGAIGTATATYVITAADVTAGSVENTATALGRHDGQTVRDTDTATITVTGPVPAPALELEKSASPSTYRAAGDEITYTFTVTNTGNVALSDVRIRDAKLGISDLAVSPSTLQPGATGTATATYVITAADVTAGSVENTATALGSYDGETVSDTDTATITVTVPPPAPALELEKSASPSTYRAAGDEITYTFTVRNSGNVPLTNVVIEDAKLGISDLAVSPSTLQPGATGTATATYVITEADVTAGTVANTATASGRHNGATVRDTDTATITVTGPPPAPALELEKSASPSTYRAAGEEITYTFTVTNTGNVALSDVRIRDAKLGISDLAVSPSTLQPGATGAATATYVITAADVTAGTVANTATASGRHNGTTVRDTDTATITVTGPPPAPALELEKSASPSTYRAAGDEITYTFTVTNTGNVPLTNVVIEDAKLGISDLAVSPSTLQPGATGSATATYVITAADVTAGTVANTATASGRHNGQTVSDTDTATITVTGPPPAPALELEKSASPSTYGAVGEEITYTFTVTNTGNVALSDVRIRDAKLGITALAVSPSTLQPGA
ncbi:hypothetical protein CKO25_20535, partial [Thiocapsa imhoffii]